MKKITLALLLLLASVPFALTSCEPDYVTDAPTSVQGGTFFAEVKSGENTGKVYSSQAPGLMTGSVGSVMGKDIFMGSGVFGAEIDLSFNLSLLDFSNGDHNFKFVDNTLMITQTSGNIIYESTSGTYTVSNFEMGEPVVINGMSMAPAKCKVTFKGKFKSTTRTFEPKEENIEIQGEINFTKLMKLTPQPSN